MIKFSTGDRPRLTDTLRVDGAVLDLTGASVTLVFQSGAAYNGSGAATVLDAAGGRVTYTFASGQTAVPGLYQAQWVVTKADITTHVPPDPFPFEIVAALPLTAQATAIADLYETIRWLLGDHDPTVPQYVDSQLASAVRGCIRLQRVPGYALTPDLAAITPALSDPNKWALVCYHVVKGYIDSNPDRYAWGTRALRESFGSWRGFLDELKLNIYRLENGAMFSGWYNYYTWLAGMSGLPLDLVLTQLNVRAPFISVDISTDGVNVSGASVSGGG